MVLPKSCKVIKVIQTLLTPLVKVMLHCLLLAPTQGAWRTGVEMRPGVKPKGLTARMTYTRSKLCDVKLLYK